MIGIAWFDWLFSNFRDKNVDTSLHHRKELISSSGSNECEIRISFAKLTLHFCTRFSMIALKGQNRHSLSLSWINKNCNYPCLWAVILFIQTTKKCCNLHLKEGVISYEKIQDIKIIIYYKHSLQLTITFFLSFIPSCVLKMHLFFMKLHFLGFFNKLLFLIINDPFPYLSIQFIC